MKYTKFILSALAVVLVASLGVVLTSCQSSAPPSTTTNNEDITISKVKLFDNTSPYAPSLLKEVSYERTVNAHKIYIKTTFVASNYINALRSVDPRIGNAYVNKTNTGDLWGPLVIGIDRVSQHLPATKNVIKLGLKVKTADPDFEFDNVIRIESAGDNNNAKANTVDGVAIVTAWGIILDTCKEGVNTETNDWWNARDNANEKKYQGGPEDTNFISGAYTEVTNEYGDTNRIDANFTYDPNTGEYVFTIPFTVIPYNDIDKIVVFGAQNPWRPGATIEAVVKPLGSSKTLVYADVNNVVAGIPVVKVPKSSSESPSLIQGSFPDVITSIATSIDAKAGAVTTNISVTLLSISSNASNMIVFTGPQGSSTVSKTNWLFYGGTNNEGDYLYTNTIVLKFSATNGYDFYAPTNYTVGVVAGNGGNATISVTVEPTISVDCFAILLTSDTDKYTINVSVADGYSTPTSAIASNVNSGATYTVTLTSGSGSFTLGGPSSTANLKGNGGDSVVVFYDDTTSGKRITSSSIKIVSGWSVAGYGEYSPWGAKIDMVAYKTNSNSLEILVTFNPIGGGNNLYLAIDVTNRTLGIDASTNTHGVPTNVTANSGDLTTGWGSFWMTNEAGIDYDFVAWGYRDGATLKYSGAHRIETNGSGTDVQSSVTVLNTNLVTANDYYFNIPFSAMGATNGNVVNIYVFFGKTGGAAGNEGIRSIFPAGASVTNSIPGGWGAYVTELTNKSPNITLP